MPRKSYTIFSIRCDEDLTAALGKLAEHRNTSRGAAIRALVISTVKRLDATAARNAKQGGAPAAPGAQLAAEELPDWLTGSQVPAAERPQWLGGTKPSTTVVNGEELPDWLASFGEGAQVPAENGGAANAT